MAPELERLRSDDAAWDAFVESSEMTFPLQLTAWAAAKAKSGWTPARVVADGGSGPIGAQVLIRRLGPGPFSLGYLPRGPVATSFDERSLAAFTDAVRAFGRRVRLSHLTADPGMEGVAPGELMATAGWQRSDAVQLGSSQVIDLDRSQEELWSDVYKSSRRYANGARKRGCRVEEGGASLLPVFHAILVETAHRSGFIPRAIESYAEVFDAFARQGRARILIGYLPDGRAVSSKLILTCGGRAAQLYGGLTDEGWQERAGHFFEWEAIVRSKAAGATLFDMWGRSTPGIAHFKQGFGGRTVEYCGTWDLVLNPIVRSLYQRSRRAWVSLARRRRGLAAPGTQDAAPIADEGIDRARRSGGDAVTGSAEQGGLAPAGEAAAVGSPARSDASGGARRDPGRGHPPDEPSG